MMKYVDVLYFISKSKWVYRTYRAQFVFSMDLGQVSPDVYGSYSRSQKDTEMILTPDIKYDAFKFIAVTCSITFSPLK